MNDFDIPEEEALEIFKKMIAPQITAGISPQKTREAILLGGQPGSGKSSLARELLKMKREIVFINGDDLRAYHTKYYFYLKENDIEVADMTQAVCNFWIEALIKKCIEQELNIMIEGTMRKNNVPLETARMLKNADYSVNVAVVSAPYELSLASLEYRYQELKRLGIPARFTKKESHDEAFRNIENTLAGLVDSGFCEKFHVFERYLNEFIESSFGQEQKKEIMKNFIEGRMRVFENREKNEVLSLAKREFKISTK